MDVGRAMISAGRAISPLVNENIRLRTRLAELETAAQVVIDAWFNDKEEDPEATSAEGVDSIYKLRDVMEKKLNG